MRRAILPMLSLAFASQLLAQDPPGPVPQDLFDTLEWRLVGPFRGGRVAAVTGVVGNRDTYYMGAAGGGVWRTTDAGKSWHNLSDGTFGGSIGAVAVAPSDQKVLYVGGGEETWRGNVSSGDGMWKSSDGGTTWAFVGLSDSRHIARIRIHPKNADVVYAAVMGHCSGPNEERGVYRTKDGGQSWQRVLFANAHAGAVDLCMAPDDPDTLYATTWRAERTPWGFSSGGDGSGLWKTTDGGDTWQPLHDRPGMPKGTLGIAGMAASPADPSRVYAMIEAEKGGLFASDDRGDSWRKVNDDASLRQRAWYYTRIYADPKAKDTCYVLNVQFHRSTDGGKTFSTVRTPHSDNHDLWIDPQDPQRMIEGNDGGANVTFDGGKTWSTQDNQPTAQFYRVTVDDDRPYRIYGAQQDNSTVRIRSRARGRGIGPDDWEATAGGESGWLAPKPGDPEIVFGGNYGGHLQRRDHRRGLSRSVDVWPDNPMGAGAEAMKYRFQWNFPILWSRNFPGRLYTSSQVLHASDDDGATWRAMSPDLTRNDPQKLVSSGGPITQDNTGVEYYCTIFTVDEGRVPGTLWCGSDDGLVHVTRDDGENWLEVTPLGMPEWMQINCICADPHRDGGCYFVGTRYKLDDFRPYVYRTEDYGATWTEISGGLDPAWFARCVRPDPLVDGLLYCGTERTVWVSYNHGRRWQRLTQNLPIVPVADLCVAGDELIAATQGRAFWSFDGLPHLRQLRADLAQQPLHVFAPVPVQQWPGSDGVVDGRGRNPADELHVRFFVGGDPEQPVGAAKLVVRDFDGELVLTRETAATAPVAESDEAAEDDADEDAEQKDANSDDDEPKPEPLVVKRGMNDVAVSWRGDKAKVLDGMILWSGRGGRARLAPGDYTLCVTVGDVTREVVGKILPDPRTDATIGELQQRYRLVRDGNRLVTQAHDAIADIRSLREQFAALVKRAPEGDARQQMEAATKAADEALRAVEEELYQTKSKSSQDPLNYPIRLTDKLLGVLGAVNFAEFGPTQGQRAVAAELSTKIRAALDRCRELREQHVAEVNRLARELAVPHVK
ncbi:MAG: glycosyl hydrolase [Planctomycetes bacterium]|nr:glycosyl hydrolase [Planctomycetota bacterium]